MPSSTFVFAACTSASLRNAPTHHFAVHLHIISLCTSGKSEISRTHGLSPYQPWILKNFAFAGKFLKLPVWHCSIAFAYIISFPLVFCIVFSFSGRMRLSGICISCYNIKKREFLLSQYDRGDVYETNTHDRFKARNVHSQTGSHCRGADHPGWGLSFECADHPAHPWLFHTGSMDQGQQRFLRRASRLSAKAVRSGSFPFRAYPAKRRIQDFQSEVWQLHYDASHCVKRLYFTCQKAGDRQASCRDLGFVCVAYYHTFHVRHAP